MTRPEALLPAAVADTTVDFEKHLEAFLALNWEQTELGKSYSIFEEDGERVGQQYETDAGPIDILAISKDRKRLLVVELNRVGWSAEQHRHDAVGAADAAGGAAVAVDRERVDLRVARCGVVRVGEAAHLVLLRRWSGPCACDIDDARGARRQFLSGPP